MLTVYVFLVEKYYTYFGCVCVKLTHMKHMIFAIFAEIEALGRTLRSPEGHLYFILSFNELDSGKFPHE